MRSVLIAHRDPNVVDGLEADLRQAGYHVVACPGPFPPKLRCIQCDTGECPLKDGADLLVYDPTLVALDVGGVVCNLAVESALAHPNIPMLVTTCTDAESEVAPSVIARAPNVMRGGKRACRDARTGRPRDGLKPGGAPAALSSKLVRSDDSSSY